MQHHESQVAPRSLEQHQGPFLQAGALLGTHVHSYDRLNAHSGQVLDRLSSARQLQSKFAKTFVWASTSAVPVFVISFHVLVILRNFGVSFSGPGVPTIPALEAHNESTELFPYGPTMPM